MYSARKVGEALRVREWSRGFDHLRMPDEAGDRAIEVRHLAVTEQPTRWIAPPGTAD